MRQLRNLAGARRAWKLPRKSRVLIYGSSGSHLLSNYISEPTSIYQHPEDSLNVSILILAIFRLRLSRIGYLYTYLKVVSPQIVITFEDNDLSFYRIKGMFPSCTTIAIQNGRRDGFAVSPKGGFFELLHQACKVTAMDASYICLFGNAVKRLYRDALGSSSRAQYLAIGSLRNNAIASSQAASEPRIIYISSMPSFVEGQLPDSEEILGYYGGNPVTYSEYWRAENMLVLELARFASAQSLPLVVLGKRASHRTAEREHFAKILVDFDWQFVSADNQSSTYRQVARRDCIVSVDGTLAYEFLGRGYRVSFFSSRLLLAGLPERRDCDFGYPDDLPAKGKFWTSEVSYSEVSRVLYFLLHSTDDEWQAATRGLKPQLMQFDPGNSRFCELLCSLGVNNTGPKYWDEAQIPRN